jgi:hypothetical protein
VEGDKMSNIPSDEDFARAHKLAAERFRNLDRACENVKQHFKRICPLHNIHILPQGDVDFRAYVFVNKNTDLEACKHNGITQEIEDFVFKELELAGRGKKADTTVAFEWDSDENVLANYEGDYFLRLR